MVAVYRGYGNRGLSQIANRAVLGLVTLTSDQLARGNVAPLVNGAPATAPADVFTIADLLLITRKAVHAVTY